jgi:hypothetical protein
MMLSGISEACSCITELHAVNVSMPPMPELPKVDPKIAHCASALVTATEGAIPSSSAAQNTVASTSRFEIASPFAGFAGRSFLRVCLLAEIFDSWIRARQESSPQQAQYGAERSNWLVAGWFRSSIGAVSCNLAAASLVAIFWASPRRSLVPLIFLFVVSYVALRFGHIAALIGTIGAAFLFASVLFEPRPSLAMSNPIERDLLYSMVIVGICASEILGRRRTPIVYKPW